MLYQMHIRHKDGRMGRVLGLNFVDACKALDWHVADSTLVNAQLTEAYVLEKQDAAVNALITNLNTTAATISRYTRPSKE